MIRKILVYLKEDSIMAVIKLTKDNFDQEVMQSDKPVLIDFYDRLVRPM